MSEFALPCIVCGKQLTNTFQHEVTNQPNDGLAFDTSGHYGSTAFDPMDGTYLEITICDECLIQKAKESKVLWNKRYLPITCDGVLVGRQWVHRPQVPWDPDVRESEIVDDTIEIDVDDVGSDKLGTTSIEWRGDWRESVKTILKARELKEKK